MLMFRFAFRHPNLLLNRPKRIFHYYQIYQQLQLQNLRRFESTQRTHQEKHNQGQKSEKLWNKMREFPSKLRMGMFELKSKSSKLNFEDISSQTKGFFNVFFQYLALYYESLQNLVEGRREVLQNDNFVMEDGESVKQKAEKFEERLRKLQGKTKRKESRINQDD